MQTFVQTKKIEQSVSNCILFYLLKANFDPKTFSLQNALKFCIQTIINIM